VFGDVAGDGESGAMRVPGWREKALLARSRRELRWAANWQAAVLAVEAAEERIGWLIAERENRLDRITGLSRGRRLAAERRYVTGRYPVRARAAERWARQIILWRAEEIAVVRARYASRIGRAAAEERKARRRLFRAAREALALWETDELARRWTGTNRSQLHRLAAKAPPIAQTSPHHED
jgi:hypothetical protein